MTEQQAIDSRYSNFYNNYNVDYHNEGGKNCSSNNDCPPAKRKGATLDGNNPCCEDYRRKPPENCECGGCPTGFKPCTMKMTPPADCDPAGIWCAQVQPCPPKPLKKVSNVYNPGPCKRPCCKHWKPKDGPCLYDDPCKAHCYDHPPGIKPSGRYPWNAFFFILYCFFCTVYWYSFFVFRCLYPDFSKCT